MMIQFFYIVIALFFFGGILISIINRNKPKEVQKSSWIKFVSYFIIVNLIFVCILFFPQYFFYVAIVISVIGFIEIIRAIYFSRKIFTGILTLLVFLILVFVFVRFARMEQTILLLTYTIVTSFDAFSQLTGQLFGKTKLIPSISPNKTWEGFMGGLVSVGLLSVLFSEVFELPVIKTVAISLLISIFALGGDLLESYSKRNFSIKDYSNLLPGHGGFLDRFDSFIASSVIIIILNYYGYL